MVSARRAVARLGGAAVLHVGAADKAKPEFYISSKPPRESAREPLPGLDYRYTAGTAYSCTREESTPYFVHILTHTELQTRTARHAMPSLASRRARARPAGGFLSPCMQWATCAQASAHAGAPWGSPGCRLALAWRGCWRGRPRFVVPVIDAHPKSAPTPRNSPRNAAWDPSAMVIILRPSDRLGCLGF